MKPRFQQQRDIVERLLLCCTLVLQESAHLGGGDSDATSDRPLLRDADGQIYLAGTSLKGILRQKTASTLLFGGDANQARLIVNDAPLVLAYGTELRDGVAIDSALGIASHGKKYDIELIPAGSRCEASFEVYVPKDEQKLVLQELCTALEKFKEGIEIGARTRRGFGRICQVGPWRLARYVGLDGLKARLANARSDAPSSWHKPIKEVEDLWEEFEVSKPSDTHHYNEIKIALDLQLVGSLLIRSPVVGSGPTDVAHLHRRSEDGSIQPVLSGTSLAGALRARCLRIAKTLLQTTDADDLIDNLFGPSDVKKGNAWASRLRVGETVLENTRTLRHTRLRIDPWTGGAVESMLFTSEPVYGGTLKPILRWTLPLDATRQAAERAMLLLVLRDLALGDLTLGGEGGTGRGRFAPMHGDGGFGQFGSLKLCLTSQRGLVGNFEEDLQALQGWKGQRP